MNKEQISQNANLLSDRQFSANTVKPKITYLLLGDA